MPRNSRSVKNLVDAALAAQRAYPLPPACVRTREGEQPFWEAIMRSRPVDDWLESDLVVAAQLARTQFDMEGEAALLEHEGTVSENARGTPVMNPRVTVLEGLARREMALMRTLRMGSRLVTEPVTPTGRLKAERAARSVAAEVEDGLRLLA